MAQYDEIAEQYKESQQLEIFRIISHTMSHWIGDVAGRSVLELACGVGDGARAIKQAGAGRVVGVDVSEQMIRLAREAEAKQPLGIEYIARAAQELGRIGEFDIVTATFLLHYARNREELHDMARAAYLNLRPGCRRASATAARSGVNPGDPRTRNVPSVRCMTSCARRHRRRASQQRRTRSVEERSAKSRAVIVAQLLQLGGGPRLLERPSELPPCLNEIRIPRDRLPEMRHASRGGAATRLQLHRAEQVQRPR
jgi:SAM-dependent methyltransferase